VARVDPRVCTKKWPSNKHNNEIITVCGPMFTAKRYLSGLNKYLGTGGTANKEWESNMCDWDFSILVPTSLWTHTLK